ncbi:MAG: serine/threonine-protein kinase [Eubacteriales bacterium]
MLNLKEECNISFYNEIATLNDKKSVYLVQHQLTGKIYVKKMLENYNGKVYDTIKSHPHHNIAKIYDVFQIDEYLMIIEEYINGMTLEELLEERGSLNEEDTRALLLQLCDALEHIHQCTPPVIHRDIKLSNVMVSNDGIVKLIDFNVSRIFKEKDAQDTVIMGTAGYAAPEQYGFKQTDARSDIYSLGILMNYLLTGKHPNEEIHKGEWGRIIKKCIFIDPNHRYKSVLKLKGALKKPHCGNKNSFSGRPFLPLPGFRSKELWKMIIALFGYAMIVFLALNMENNLSPLMNIVDKIMIMAVFLSYVSLYTNYLGVKEMLPLVNHRMTALRILGYVIYPFIMLIFYAIIIGGLGTFL